MDKFPSSMDIGGTAIGKALRAQANAACFEHWLTFGNGVFLRVLIIKQLQRCLLPNVTSDDIREQSVFGGLDYQLVTKAPAPECKHWKADSGKAEKDE